LEEDASNTCGGLGFLRAFLSFSVIF